jgi:hypothetical protein
METFYLAAITAVGMAAGMTGLRNAKRRRAATLAVD